jgi:hypothetical protein
MITRAEKGTRVWRKPMQNGGAGIREIRILTSTSIERVSQSRYRIRCSGDLRIERRGHFHCHGSQLVVRRFVSEGLTQNLAYALVSLSSRNDMSPPRADGPTQARCSDRVSSHHSDHQVKFATMASHPKNSQVRPSSYHTLDLISCLRARDPIHANLLSHWSCRCPLRSRAAEPSSLGCRCRSKCILVHK